MAQQGCFSEMLAAIEPRDAAPDHCRDVWVPEKMPECHYLLGTKNPLDRADGVSANYGPGAHEPTLFHKVKNQKSILTLVVSESKIYAGTQDGELKVWTLDTYELLSTIPAHRGSVLCLFLSVDKARLFSSAGDAIVNVWCAKTLNRLYSIYSTYDVGDIFCVAYSAALQTVYLGAQNTSIQWYSLLQKDIRSPRDFSSHPSQRNHRFFDSKGPGGTSTPRPLTVTELEAEGGQVLEIDKGNIIQYAHYGYVYCMILAKGLNSGLSDEETLISGGGDGTIKLWSLDKEPEGAIRNPVILENGDGSILAMVLDGTLLYSGRLDGDINVWDLDTRQMIRRIKAHTADVLTLAVGRGLLFSGSANGFAKQFDSRYECITRWKAHDQLILASAIAHHDGKAIYVTGGNDDCIAIWDIGDHVKDPRKGSVASNEQLLVALSEFVSYRTVSSKPEYAKDCRSGASWLRSLFKTFGADTEMFVTEDSTNPIVFARFRGKNGNSRGAKKILFYGHYDVVTADDKTRAWIENPFKMHGTNGYLYGRGVSDNKGPVLAAIYAVADVIARQELSSDIVFLIEGEEERGSRGFQATIKKNKHIIGDIDWILLANSYWLDDNFPCLTYGLRGVVHATVEVQSDRPDLHSGVDGSHLIHEASKDLVGLLALLTGANGEVTIPGFYDPILPITDAENERYEAISKTLLRRDPSLGDAESLAESFKARWREPSLTIHRINTSGPANSTIISRLATADLSIRLVPDQHTTTIERALRDILHSAFEKLHTTNKLTIKINHQAEPWLGDPDNQIFQILEEAIMEVWGHIAHKRRGSAPTKDSVLKKLAMTNGSESPRMSPVTSSTLSNGSDYLWQATADISDIDKHEDEEQQQHFPSRLPPKPLYIREGGSIPAIRFLEQEFDAPAAHLPCGQASDNAHLDNERLRLSNLYKSRQIFAKVFRELPLR